MFGDLPERPKYHFIFHILYYSALVSIVLFIFNKTFFFAALGLFFINLIINNFFAQKISKYFAGFSSLNKMLITAQSLAKLKNNNLEEIKYLSEQRNIIKKINKKLGSLVLDKAAMNEIFMFVVEYMNIFFLYDLRKYSTSVGMLQQNQIELQKVFFSIAKLDFSISMASYLTNIETYSTPKFREEKDITLENVYHPLIIDAVPNSLSNLESSVLITGSNMAGKTTFIKTVGVNFILAQTLNICHAKNSIIPKLIVKSAIRREDNLEDFKSYFFVEVEELLDFINNSKNNDNYIFLIDEIFRGTNTVERLSASKAVLGYLDKSNFVFVTTHDIELQDLLKNKFKMFHFSEQVNDKNLTFDYKIKSGHVTSGNAIKLLEIKNYPSEIISDALKNLKKV